MLQATSMTYRLIRLRSLRFETLAQSIHLARRSLELRRAGLELSGPHLDDTPNVLGLLIESFSPPPDVSHARTSEPLSLAYARGANDDTGKGQRAFIRRALRTVRAPAPPCASTWPP